MLPEFRLDKYCTFLVCFSILFMECETHSLTALLHLSIMHSQQYTVGTISANLGKLARYLGNQAVECLHSLSLYMEKEMR